MTATTAVKPLMQLLERQAADDVTVEFAASEFNIRPLTELMSCAAESLTLFDKS